LWRGAEQVAIAGTPGLALHFLAILGVAGDRPVAVDDVLALLWPELPRDDARRELAALVASLPAWLGGSQPVRADIDEMRLDDTVVASDVHDFEFAAASGAPDDAAKLYAGAFLEGVTPSGKSFERWREREGARFAQLAKWCREAARPRQSKVTLTAGARVGHGGRYRIERELGAGGAATVYLAHDSRHDRQVALKVLRPDISESISPERFEKEIRFVAQLQHPHILPLFDSGEIGTVLYSVMPYVVGETVRQRLERAGKLPVEEAVRIAAEVADALAYAHEHGVLHRDVKPENILLADGHALIADFGIARSVNSQKEGRTTLPGVVLGTAAYMSPEQATGEENLDGRTDVYAVGAVLYEMLTGAPPFAGETARRTMTRRLTEVPPPVSKLGVHVPAVVDEALARALQPLPQDRATSRELASALSTALRRLSQHVPSQATNRNRGLVVSGAIIAAAALALFFAARCAGAQAAPRMATDTTLLRRMLVAEDARGMGVDGIAPLLEGAGSKDTLLRRVAIRALGRLQRPDQLDLLLSKLDDPSPAIRMETVNALAQSVQGVPRMAGGSNPSRDGRDVLPAAQSALLERLRSESNLAVVGVIARSLGRWPIVDSAFALRVEHAIALRVGCCGDPSLSLFRLPAAAAHDVAEGLYALARARRSLGDPYESVQNLRTAARYGADARVRRVGLLGLTAAGALDSATVLLSVLDADPQVRRLSLAGVATLGSASREAVVRRALADTSATVRVDAIRAARVGAGPPDCAPIISLTRDADPHVMLAAIDGLAAPCADTAARSAALRAIAAGISGGDAHRTSGHATWHAPAHAIVALARADSAAASAVLATFAAHPVNHVREYAARAAAQLKDAATLLRLAADADDNVRDAAIAALSQVRRHATDSVYIAALASRGYQVVLAASAALAGSTHAAAVPALLDALDRISADRRENSRDPRVALLTQLGQLGAPLDAPRLQPYLTDFDSTVAAKAADILTKWTLTKVAARPVPLAIRAEPLAEIFASHGLQLRITMDRASGGGTFVVRLFSDEAPATVARMVRLARAHYFDGLTFHRIATNFVLQGGSPGATEYIGDGPFMRDELGLRSHDRGTLGISTRGRDTGDAQLFVNVVDNPRLDHDYTVFGMIVSGMAVVDQIIEGDVMARVEVIGGR
jgi:cyclophilin family peptidyl-prolyl cis-trans isomerase/tRNA A-37 threonylcarbamoyl transferase component Bud32